MAIVKGKVRLCQASLGDFDVEQINGSPFYNRYLEFMRLFGKYITKYDPVMLFAQPEVNQAKASLDWYIPKPNGNPITLQELKESQPAEFARYSALKTEVVQSLNNTVSSISNPEERKYFECAMKFLDYEYADKVIYCYDDKLTFSVWGMRMRKGKLLESVIRDDVSDHRTHNVRFTIEGKGRLEGQTQIIRKHGYVLTVKDIPVVIADSHYAHTEWKPEAPHGKIVNSDVVYSAVCTRVDDFQISFVAAEGGTIIGSSLVNKKMGEPLGELDVPQPSPFDGYHFAGWSPTINFGSVLSDDCQYTAIFEKFEKDDIESPVSIPPNTPSVPLHQVSFDAGENGILYGDNFVKVNHGEAISDNLIPSVKPKEGYTFTGWDRPLHEPVTNNIVYTAQYERHKLPWWKRFWLWLTGSGCLTWLIRMLIVVLIAWLLFWLFKSCKGCAGSRDVENGVGVIDSVRTSDGGYVEDNGHARPITDDEGRLPDDRDGVAAPVMGDGGSRPPVVERPGSPNIIANRLFLFLENEDDSVDALAKDFKKAYPSDEYQIIGFDREVKMLIIQIPEEERDQIRQTINNKIPNHKFIVFDEEIYELHGHVSPIQEDVGWHLKAIHLKQGWAVTKGSKNVKVAVVDDGFQANHPMFKGRIVDAYNVFTQDNRLSLGEGHGTHTAGLAVGSDEFYSKGASGVAPGCMLMPIQVFDNKQCPLSALVAGVMYAVHHDADVVNLSVGPSFEGLKMLPVDQQKEIASTQFRNVAALWARVSRLAAKKNTILVFAAGNDDILTSIPPENRNESSIVVTAVDKRMYPTDFTNYGPCSDISAPGKNIYSSFPTSSFESCDGTSMSAPIVAGTIALMKSIKKDLTVKQACNVLFSTGADVYGWIPPMVLVDRALEATKRGDFKRVEREVRPVPDDAVVDGGSGYVPGANGGSEGGITPPAITPGEENYDEILRLIREHEKAIADLKKQLPVNKR